MGLFQIVFLAFILFVAVIANGAESQGVKGALGPCEPPGVSTLTGLTGTRGPRAPKGFSGQKGRKGSRGPQGRIGWRGPPGLLGPPGNKGTVGKPGPGGPQGEKGSSGEKGIIGVKGLKGDRGPPGPKGNPGSRESRDRKGKRGADGPMGKKGDVGAMGLPGVKGEQGPPGSMEKSAGTSFVRWGWDLCSTRAETVVSGIVMSTNGKTTGSLLCVPAEPELPSSKSELPVDKSVDKTDLPANETLHQGASSRPLMPVKMGTNVLTCAICYLDKRATVFVFPATTVCPKGWMMEYHGNLVVSSSGGSEYVCIDRRVKMKDDGTLISMAVLCEESDSGCFGYQAGRQLTCVVCSR